VGLPPKLFKEPIFLHLVLLYLQHTREGLRADALTQTNIGKATAFGEAASKSIKRQEEQERNVLSRANAPVAIVTKRFYQDAIAAGRLKGNQSISLT